MANSCPTHAQYTGKYSYRQAWPDMGILSGVIEGSWTRLYGHIHDYRAGRAVISFAATGRAFIAPRRCRPSWCRKA